ncbi:hypothetical protein V1293_003425 [Bradyrhizobium sp. AZCC 1693]
MNLHLGSARDASLRQAHVQYTPLAGDVPQLRMVDLGG